jgi:transcriptional/translational regulatory protein YebC/TACO1
VTRLIRAIQRGAGGEDNDDLKEVTYEGYGVVVLQLSLKP